MGIASGGTQAGPLVVTGGDSWSGQFEQARPRLRSVAYRILGSLAGADDAVHEAVLVGALLPMLTV
jgi:hypothetical protein